ncbi:MAG: TatD family hydrolase [Burkholderiales bacterium]
MPLIDSHCHLDAPELAADIQPVRALARERGVAHCVIPAVDVHNLDAVRGLAHQLGDSYALGIHPLCSNQATRAHLDRLAQRLAEHKDDPRLVAVGEIGLDYFVDDLDDSHQQRIYREQLKLARDHGLPVILHSRRGVDKVLKHLREIDVPGGIAHAFNGSLQQAEEFLKLGFKLGFGGAATYERATRLHALLRELPLSAIVLETDSPDIPPHWIYRTAAEREAGAKQGRNTPAELPRIASCIAGVRGIDPEELAAHAFENTLAALPRLRALTSAGLWG